ncbi:MAG: hypothetical protein ACK40G_14485 [Cytophagaceae bacterium]
MRKNKPIKLPKVLTEEIITILAKMANEIPQPIEWHQIFEILNENDIQRIMDRKVKIQIELEKSRKDKMTEQEKENEKLVWEKIKNDPDPNKFYGNMGQPETPQEYKNRYGQWPPGYDKDGNKLT